jgi:2-hydroxychromene-2-carboxylate isomerase
MGIPTALKPLVIGTVTSPRLRDTRRSLAEWRRRLTGGTHTAEMFLRLDDPYAWLLAQAMTDLRQRFGLEVPVRVVHQLPPEMYPDPEALRRWALTDARRLADLNGLDAPAADRQATDADAAAFLDAVEAGAAAEQLDRALAFLSGWWRGDPSPAPSAGAPARLRAHERRLTSGGHYLSATVRYGGEWYWGIDRLDHLERRLIELGLGAADETPRWVARHRLLAPPPPGPAPGEQPLILYWSARSPYSYLVLERTFRLADAFGVPLDIRPVLPMVMRGLAVPFAKRIYIVQDTKREAELLGLAFGRAVDPLGPAVERCYALFRHARAAGRERALVLEFARGVWSQAEDAASDRGLRAIVERSGLDWETARPHLDDPGWRDMAEANRQEMRALGFWGVPGARYGDVSAWGQDRLWVIEDALRAAVTS